MGKGDNDGGGGDGGENVYKKRAKPVLVSLSDSYSGDDAILVGNSRYSFYPAYTVY